MKTLIKKMSMLVLAVAFAASPMVFGAGGGGGIGGGGIGGDKCPGPPACAPSDIEDMSSRVKDGKVSCDVPDDCKCCNE